MIYVLQNMNQKVIAVTGANIFRSLYASTAFVLELFIHFFFRSESSLSFHELISSFLWAYLVYLKEFFLEITVKIGIDCLKSIKQILAIQMIDQHIFSYVLSFVWRNVEYCVIVPFPGFHQVLQYYCSSFYEVQGNWPVKIFQIFGFIFIFWGLVFECKAILAYSC